MSPDLPRAARKSSAAAKAGTNPFAPSLEKYASVPDPRLYAYRPDLAAAELQHQVKADAYIDPQMRQSIQGLVPLFAKPDAKSDRVSEIRYGEYIDLYEEREDGFAWVQNRSDRMVGYIPFAPDKLSDHISDLSRRVSMLHCFVHEEPSPKAPLCDTLYLGSYVHTTRTENGYAELSSGGYVFAGHIEPTDFVYCADYVFTAGRFLNTPYLPGGRSARGLDAPALVQIALDLAGYECPRLLDLQQKEMATPLSHHWRDMIWKRGDLVYFKDHVGFMVDGTHLISADPDPMRVAVSTLEEQIAKGRVITGLARLF